MRYTHRSIKHELSGDNTLYVVTMISNPARYHSRYALYEQFAKHIQQSKEAKLVTIELAFGDRQFEITSPDNPDHIQLRTNHELWLKENALNLAIKRLDPSWRYVAWVDADIAFDNPHWCQETMHQLQHHPIVQMFSTATDLGPHYDAMNIHQGFAKAYVTGKLKPPVGCEKEYYTKYNHPGFCWAATKTFYEGVEKLLDIGVLGAADRHMCLSIVGHGEHSIEEGMHPNYKKAIMDWQRKALFFHKNIGYVNGNIDHFWHGRKRDRKYHDRWSILLAHQFDPETDLQYDSQGLLYFRDPTRIGLRDSVRNYFRQRLEDSMEE